MALTNAQRTVAVATLLRTMWNNNVYAMTGGYGSTQVIDAIVTAIGTEFDTTLTKVLTWKVEQNQAAIAAATAAKTAAQATITANTPG